MPYHESKAPSCIDAILYQLNAVSGNFRTIYIGGGTPTVLGINLLKKLLTALEKRAERPCEFTIEANPESLDEERLSLFTDKGINRISIGVQSFNNAKLKILGRVHDAFRAKKAVESARKKGFKNISVDLIFGVLSESPEDWKKDLEEAVKLPVKHISCYCLDFKKLEGSEEDAADMYAYAMDRLNKEGFRQYEVSNFSKDNRICRHNMTYWDNGPYIGLGPSAVSYQDGKREENVSDAADYIKKVRAGQSVISSSEDLDKESRAKETAAVKIRTMEGINLEWFKRNTGFDFLSLERSALPGLLEKGLIEYTGIRRARGGIRLSRRGILFCDIVSSAFL